MARSVIKHMKISVIICTHNPKEKYLQRTLQALSVQSLPMVDWELILVDNASEAPVEGRFPTAWHPAARTVRETELGLTPARLCGIRESSGRILVFVDDDNLLGKDYLENAWRIAESHPFLGAWGGTCLAEYEKEPPAWFDAYEGNIAVRRIDTATWSNRYFDYASTPVGAGMCLRSEVALGYSDRLINDKTTVCLDRKGSSLMSCGDHDMAWTSMELGLGVGVFPSLELVHIIPPGRTKADYILKLLEADACSSALLRHRIMGSVNWPSPPRRFHKLRTFIRSGINLLAARKENIHSMANAARLRGSMVAKNILKQDKVGNSSSDTGYLIQ